MKMEFPKRVHHTHATWDLVIHLLNLPQQVVFSKILFLEDSTQVAKSSTIICMFLMQVAQIGSNG